MLQDQIRKSSYNRQPDTHTKWDNQKSRNTHRQQERECDFCDAKRNCPAKRKKCLVCKKKPHFAHVKVCPSKCVGIVQQVSDESTSEDDVDSYIEDTDDTDEITGKAKTVHQIPSSSIEGNEMVEVQFSGITTK